MAPLYRASNVTTAGSGTTISFTKPTGTAAGDLLVINLWINGTTQPNSTPAGFSKILEEAAGGTLNQAWVKTAGGSEPASYDFGWASSITKGGGVVAVRSDAAATLVVSDSDQQTNASSTNRECPSVTPTAAATLVMFIVASIGQRMTPDALSTERYDLGLGPCFYCMTENVSAGATGTRTATGISNSSSQTITIAVSEIVTIGGTASITLDDITLTATGTVAIKGAASITLGAVTLSATGNVASTPILGAASITLDAITLVAEGELRPDAPTTLTATAISASRIDLTWDNDDVNVIAYSIERSANGLTGWSEIDTTISKSYSNTGLTANTRYYYRVRAIKA